MISVSYRSLLGRCKIIASVKRLRCTARLHKIDASRKQLRCTARLHKIDASRKQLRCTDRLQHCVATAIVTQRRGIKTTFSNSSPKTLACETFVYKALTVFNSSRKRLRPNSGWNADAQARLRLNSCWNACCSQLCLNSGWNAEPATTVGTVLRASQPVVIQNFEKSMVQKVIISVLLWY